MGKTVEVLEIDFQEKAMGDWVSSQSLNEVSRDLRENYEAIQNASYLPISIFIGIVTIYFLSERNWIIVLLLLILLIIISLPRLKYLKFRRKEIIEAQNKIRRVCKSRGLKIPEGYK